MATARNSKARSELVEWLLLDERTRRLHGLPLTQEEFAAAKGLSGRTIHRWKSDPSFEALLAQRRAENGKRLLDNSTLADVRPHRDARAKRRFEPPAPAGPGDDPAVREALKRDIEPGTPEFQYVAIRTILAEQAVQGDGKSLELWMRYFGADLVEQERAEREVTFTDWTDDQLIASVLGLIGREAVATWLADAAAAA